MGRYKRCDAERITGLEGYHNILPYIMPKRTEAEVCLKDTLDLTELNRYIRERNEAEGTHLKMFHLFCTAFARTIYNRPRMNCFIAGRRFWQRKDIVLSFTAKQAFTDEAIETLMFMKVKPEMTVDDVSHIILGDLKKARDTKGNDLDKTMNFVGSLPRFVLEILFAVLRKLEYFGIFPESLMKGDPNYSSAMLANLGSIKSGAPYHHLSNYGTCSVMCTIGTMKTEKAEMPDGTVEPRDLVEISITTDERIADGFYFIKSLRLLKYMLENPKVLEQRMDEPLPEGICD